RAERALFAPFRIFFPGLALWVALAFGGATARTRFATRAFLVVFAGAPAAVACAGLVASVIEVIVSPWVVVSAVTTSITRVPLKCKSNLHPSGGGDGRAMEPSQPR